MSNKFTIPLAIVFGGVIVAISVYVSMPKATPESSNGGNPALVRPVGASDHILGNPAAKVMIVEYADFDCEYCSVFDATLHQVIADEGTSGKVAWVFREFPLIEIHPNAMTNAEAAECVAQTAGNDAFWQFKTELFSHQPIDPTQYGTFAQTIGLSGNAFASCFANASTTVDARIMADRQNALDMGAQGTPYSLIIVAGKPPVVMSGGYSYDAAKALVDQALQGAQ
ncbi:MAG: DsbA family protein [Minisyncoccota bacterium]